MFWLLDVMNVGEYRRGYTNGTSTETGNIRHTRRRQTKQKHNTICVWHHYMQTNTYNVKKTRTLLHRTGGKDEPNIALCRNRNCWIMSGHIALQRSTTNHSWLNERLLIRSYCLIIIQQNILLVRSFLCSLEQRLYCLYPDVPVGEVVIVYRYRNAIYNT